MRMIQNKNRASKLPDTPKTETNPKGAGPKRGRKKSIDREEILNKAIRGMAKQGYTLDYIADELGVSRAWLTKNYQDEIKSGRTIGNALVVENMYNQALKDSPSSIQAGQFILRTQVGWKEKPSEDQINPRPTIVFNFADLSYEERIALLSRAQEKLGGPLIIDGEYIDQDTD